MSLTREFMDTNYTVTITNDDGVFYALQGMAGGMYLAVRVDDVPLEDPPDVDSLPVYLVRDPLS